MRSLPTLTHPCSPSSSASSCTRGDTLLLMNAPRDLRSSHALPVKSGFTIRPLLGSMPLVIFAGQAGCIVN